MKNSIKISAKYWEGLTQIEQDYIRERIGKNTIPELKAIIAAARKQHPDFVKIYGKGFIELPNGGVALWSGFDTRKFQPVNCHINQ